MSKADNAKALFLQGYNCAQAVLCAFADELGIEPDQARALAACFGGGLGGQREVCGAVSAMCMVLSLKYAPKDPTDHAAKTIFYKRIEELCSRFRAENGSIICRELLGLGPTVHAVAPQPRTEKYYKNRPCPDKVKSAAAIVENYLEELSTK